MYIYIHILYENVTAVTIDCMLMCIVYDTHNTHSVYITYMYRECVCTYTYTCIYIYIYTFI